MPVYLFLACYTHFHAQVNIPIQQLSTQLSLTEPKTFIDVDALGGEFARCWKSAGPTLQSDTTKVTDSIRLFVTDNPKVMSLSLRIHSIMYHERHVVLEASRITYLKLCWVIPLLLLPCP